MSAEAEYEENVQKFWSIYVNQAGQHDTILTETWKADMESTLIFAGLFSATVTAFILESYKQLSPHPSDILRDILAVQIATAQASPNGIVSIPELTSGTLFVQNGPSVAVNILWFLSLACSLGAALCVTLVQQWIRDYLQRVQRYSQSQKRARIRGFLFAGIQKWKMEEVVEIIPTLLHLSLLLFFVGLCIFIGQINQAVTAFIVVIMFFSLAFYFFATFAPLLDPSAPYETPLSPLLWRILQNMLHKRAYHVRLSDLNSSSWETELASKNLGIAREQIATRPAQKEDSIFHESRALNWVYSEITDDQELERFVECIPGFLRGDGAQNTWPLVFDLSGDALMQSKVVYLLKETCSVTGQLLGQNTRQRRAAICLDSLLALASLPIPTFSNLSLSNPQDPGRKLFALSIEKQVFRLQDAARDAAVSWKENIHIYTRCLCTAVVYRNRGLFAISHDVERLKPKDIYELSRRADAALQNVMEIGQLLDATVKMLGSEPYTSKDVALFLEVYVGVLESIKVTLAAWGNAVDQVLKLFNVGHGISLPSLLSWYCTLPRHAGFRVIYQDMFTSPNPLELSLYPYQVLAHLSKKHGEFYYASLLPHKWFPLQNPLTIVPDVRLVDSNDPKPSWQEFEVEKLRIYTKQHTPNPQDLQPITALLDALDPSFSPTAKVEAYMQKLFFRDCQDRYNYKHMSLAVFAQDAPFCTFMSILEDIGVEGHKFSAITELVLELKSKRSLSLDASAVGQTLRQICRDSLYRHGPRAWVRLSEGSQTLFIHTLHVILVWEQEASADPSIPFPFLNEDIEFLITEVLVRHIDHDKVLEHAENTLGKLGDGLSPSDKSFNDEDYEETPNARNTNIVRHIRKQRRIWRGDKMEE
ncbi:hypothetical protein H0H87_005517 [Tephrocybe sp. NHM501043]|nr:hypothetical protein H0H87_005517 [Tephrocybe sp. NHM501043]